MGEPAGMDEFERHREGLEQAMQEFGKTGSPAWLNSAGVLRAVLDAFVRSLLEDRERLWEMRDAAGELRHALVVIRDSVPMDKRYLDLSRDAMLQHGNVLAAIHADAARREGIDAARTTQAGKDGEHGAG